MGNLRININGLVWIALISVMLGIAAYLDWKVNWWYVVVADIIYSIAVLVLSSVEKPKLGTNEVDGIARLLLGCHLVFIFLIIGLLIHFPDSRLIDLTPVIDWLKQLYHISILVSILVTVGLVLGAILILILEGVILSLSSEDGYEALLIVMPAELVVIWVLVSLDVREGYFIASVMGGLLLPFLLLNSKNNISFHGIAGIIFVTLMLGVAYYYNWSINWWFFVITTSVYAITLAYLTLLDGTEATSMDSTTRTTKTEIIHIDPRIWSACHLSACLFLGSLFLNFQNGIEWLLGLGSIFAGFALSFILLKKK